MLCIVYMSTYVPIVCMFNFNVCTVYEQILVLFYGKIGHRSKGDTVLCGHLTSKYSPTGTVRTYVCTCTRMCIFKFVDSIRM